MKKLNAKPRTGWPLVIDYAFATSTNAERLGYGSEGCWTLTARHPDICNPRKELLAGSPDTDEVVEYARELLEEGAELDRRHSQPEALGLLDGIAA